jgi:hypothetical protein
MGFWIAWALLAESRFQPVFADAVAAGSADRGLRSALSAGAPRFRGFWARLRRQGAAGFVSGGHAEVLKFPVQFLFVS